MLNLKSAADIEACHNSVVMKSIKVFGRLMNFNCKTQDVLITETEPEKIYAKLAELQKNCFWMFGEGKIDIGTRVCAICNIVSFDDELHDFSQENYYQYLEKTKIPGKDFNYLFYLYKTEKFAPSTQKIAEFETSNKYIIFYVYQEQSILNKILRPLIGEVKTSSIAGILPYNSETISAMNCEQFATST